MNGPAAESGWSAAMRRRLAGLGFLAILVGLLALSVAAYQKVFTPAIWVTLHADRIGMQLNDGAEVKLRGVVVGEVRDVSADGARAALRLALDPAVAGHIPANVTARLLPKTLFGEKYVELVVPADAGARPIRAGAVIDQDRTRTAIELERALDGALPLLQAIEPDKLAATLGALAHALEGRGDRLGRDLVTLDGLLAQLNAQLPTIAEDLRLLARVIETYDGAADDLLAILRDLTVTATTISDQRAQLAGFLAETTDLAENTRAFLDRHDDRIIRLGRVSRPVLELLAVYAPEYPCLLRGIVALQPRVEEAFAGGRMHITLEITRDGGKYEPGRDEPVYAASGGPHCHGLPDPAVPAPSRPAHDGYDYGGPRGPVAMGIAGTAEEQAVIKPLVAAATGTPATGVSDTAVLLWGPLLRGTVVNAA